MVWMPASEKIIVVVTLTYDYRADRFLWYEPYKILLYIF
jgi:hypothetical protein